MDMTTRLVLGFIDGFTPVRKIADSLGIEPELVIHAVRCLVASDVVFLVDV